MKHESVRFKGRSRRLSSGSCKTKGCSSKTWWESPLVSHTLFSRRTVASSYVAWKTGSSNSNTGSSKSCVSLSTVWYFLCRRYLVQSPRNSWNWERQRAVCDSLSRVCRAPSASCWFVRLRVCFSSSWSSRYATRPGEDLAPTNNPNTRPQYPCCNPQILLLGLDWFPEERICDLSDHYTDDCGSCLPSCSTVASFQPFLLNEVVEYVVKVDRSFDLELIQSFWCKVLAEAKQRPQS